ncbi:MAG: COG1361 S-layer family protein [Candidatus Micrarchaeota archaeon]|nr:COG1361 S-layer family protein [Candidatus Micrarchaeota archaeon]
MENARILAIAVTLGLLLLPAQSFALSTGALSLVNVDVTPQPVVAGQEINISFNLYNSYQDSLQDVDLYLVGNYPILNFSPAYTQLITVMGTGLYGGVNSQFKYKIQLPKEIAAGTYTVYVEATYQTVLSSTQNTTAVSVLPLTFYVSGTPNLVLTANPANAVVPGQPSVVQLTALNVGTDNATNVSIDLLNNANFSPTGAGIYYLGTVQPKQSATALMTLQSNSSLMGGEATMPVRVSYSTRYGSQVNQTVEVPISVLISTPNIVPSIANAQPPTLYSGSNQTITVALSNIGTGTAKNVTASFISTPDITVSSSASNLFISSIAPGQTVDETVLILASKSANQTNYAIPVSLSYQTANYQRTINKTSQLKITLQPAASFNITGASSNVAPGSTYVPITFTIRNTGNEVAQHITLSFQTIYPLAPVNSNQYVQQLAPGESAQVTFYVNVDQQGNPGSYPVTVYEQWTQPNGATSQQYVTSESYYATVGGGGGAVPGGSSLYLIIGAIVVIGAGIFLYRRMQAGKAKREKKG